MLVVSALVPSAHASAASSPLTRSYPNQSLFHAQREVIRAVVFAEERVELIDGRTFNGTSSTVRAIQLGREPRWGVVAGAPERDPRTNKQLGRANREAAKQRVGVLF